MLNDEGKEDAMHVSIVGLKTSGIAFFTIAILAGIVSLSNRWSLPEGWENWLPGVFVTFVAGILFNSFWTLVANAIGLSRYHEVKRAADKKKAEEHARQQRAIEELHHKEMRRTHTKYATFIVLALVIVAIILLSAAFSFLPR